MTPGCNKISHPMAQAYTPKGANAFNPFSGHVSKPQKAMNHSSVASKFYGTPAIKASFKIGKY